MAEPKYLIEPAKTGRSRCKDSGQLTEHEELRFGSSADMMGTGFDTSRKLDCLRSRIVSNVEAKVNSVKHVDDFAELCKGQQATFRKATEVAKSGCGILGNAKDKCKVSSGEAITRVMPTAASAVCKDLLPQSDSKPPEVVAEEIVDLLQLLVHLGISSRASHSYVEILQEKGFDCSAALLTLSEDDLLSMGVLLGHRRLILQHIASSKQARNYGSLHQKNDPKATCSLAPSFFQRSTAARRWKRTQERYPEAAEVVGKLRRTRSKSLAEEMGMGLDAVRDILRENDEADAAGLHDS